MKLRILGAHAPYAPANKACNSYFLATPEAAVMLDCGNGSLAKLQNYYDFRALDALVITHYHPDHFHDYHCLRHAIANSIRVGSRRKGPLAVYAPALAAGGAWQEMQEWQGVFQMYPVEEYQQQPARIGDLSLRFQKNVHTVDCYAVSICRENHKLVYTSDTGWYEALLGLVSGADLLLCEASLLNCEEELATLKGHLTAGQTGTLAAQAAVKKLVLTHLWPETDPQLLSDQARENYAGEIIIAREGLLLEIGQ